MSEAIETRSVVEMAEGIIFATEQTNRLLGHLLGTGRSMFDDTAVVSQAMLDMLPLLEKGRLELAHNGYWQLVEEIDAVLSRIKGAQS